jgi:hypothetical protein
MTGWVSQLGVVNRASGVRATPEAISCAVRRVAPLREGYAHHLAPLPLTSRQVLCTRQSGACERRKELVARVR